MHLLTASSRSSNARSMAASLDFPPDRELRPGASTIKITCYETLQEKHTKDYKRQLLEDQIKMGVEICQTGHGNLLIY